MLIREDSHGLYIRSRWHTAAEPNHPCYRPGTFNGHSHAVDTSAGNLKAGDNPKTYHVSGAPFIKITCDDGTVLYWGSYGRTEGDYPITT